MFADEEYDQQGRLNKVGSSPSRALREDRSTSCDLMFSSFTIECLSSNKVDQIKEKNISEARGRWLSPSKISCLI